MKTKTSTRTRTTTPPRKAPAAALEDLRLRHHNERRHLYFSGDAKWGRALEAYGRKVAAMVERQTRELVEAEAAARRS